MTNSIIVSKFQHLGFDVEVSQLQYQISTTTFETMKCNCVKISHDDKIFMNNKFVSENLCQTEDQAKIWIKDLQDCSTIEQVVTYISCYLTDWDAAEISTDCAAFAINYLYNKLSKK